MYKILVIEDDKKLEQQVLQMLTEQGYEGFYIKDFSKVMEEVEQTQPDLIILDLNLPVLDGIYYCHAIRKKYTMPIIITSARNSDADQILGMELGSDDYVVKPFSIQVLMSRIAAALRRAYGEYNPNKEDNGQPGKKDNMTICLHEQSMKLQVYDRMVDLTKNEYKLLKCFLDAPDIVIKRETLLDAIWDDKSFVDDNTLTVNVTRIKRIFDDLGINDVIKTKRSVGYQFCMEAFHEER